MPRKKKKRTEENVAEQKRRPSKARRLRRANGTPEKGRTGLGTEKKLGSIGEQGISEGARFILIHSAEYSLYKMNKKYYHILTSSAAKHHWNKPVFNREAFFGYSCSGFSKDTICEAVACDIP